MLARHMQEQFLIELNKEDALVDILSRDILYWLNEGVRKFVKTRYGGSNIKGTSYEETQKRIDDLRRLVEDVIILTGLTITNITVANPGVVTVSDLGDLQNGDTVLVRNVSGMTEINDTEHTVANLSVGASTFEISNTSTYTVYTSGGYAYTQAVRDNTFKAALPVNYWFATSEQVKFDYTSNSSYLNRIRGVVEMTSDRLEFALQDPYSEHIFHYDEAKPLRIFIVDDVEFTTDGNYYIREYLLKYLKRPVMIVLSSSAIVAGANVLIIGATYEVDTGANVTHNSVTYSAGDTFIAVNNVLGGAGAVSTVGDCDLADHTHNEIVKTAIALYLGSVDDPRLPVKEAETSKME